MPLTNIEKGLIHKALTDSITSLSMALGANHNGAEEDKEEKSIPKKIIETIEKASTNPLSDDFKFAKLPKGLFKRTEISVNTFRALFNPTHEHFKQIHQIYDPHYAKATSEMSEAEFNKKIPDIKIEVASRLGKMIDQRSDYLPYKYILTCLKNSNDNDKNSISSTPPSLS